VVIRAHGATAYALGNRLAINGTETALVPEKLQLQ
jgi:hypothetical protein